MRVKIFIFLLFVNTVFADECTLLKQNPVEFLKTQDILSEQKFACDGSAFALNEIQRLLKVAKQIRNDSEACVGNGFVTQNLSKFAKRVMLASFAHESYLKTLEKPEIAETIKNKQSAFLRYFGYQSFENFAKFKEFWSAYNDAQTPLVKFYEKKGLDMQSAAFYATNVLNEFLEFAVEQQFINDTDISQEQKILSDKNAGEEVILSILYSKKITQNELDKILKTALLLNKDTQVISHILKIMQSLENGDESPLFYALSSVKNIQLLLENGADVNHKNSLGKSVLFYAISLKDVQLIKILLDAGANVNEHLIDLNTKNIMASMGQSLPFYTRLCELEHTNLTLFMHAAANANAEILQILLDAGASVDALDDLGFNALDHANKVGNEQNVKFLEQIGLKPNIE